MFNLVIGLQENEIRLKKVIRREAVKAVIMDGQEVFMIKTNKGDYKFPGGGVDGRETVNETLTREIREETGFHTSTIGEKIGAVIERRYDMYDKDSIFQMSSAYYTCSVSGISVQQELDDYEKELGFEPIWIDIIDAISQNENILTTGSREINPWVKRETDVLKLIASAMNYGGTI